jgi:hypothetical protein
VIKEVIVTDKDKKGLVNGFCGLMITKLDFIEGMPDVEAQIAALKQFVLIVSDGVAGLCNVVTADWSK